MSQHILSTGQTFCADQDGSIISCGNTGQDAEFSPGQAWDPTRFIPDGEAILDTTTGLVWLKDANPVGFPITWQEAFEFVQTMNKDHVAGFTDWRLPNRRELFSLVSFDSHSPSLPAGHPFTNVFHGWYWTSTTSAMHESQAWHLHMMGGRMFWGNKTGYELVWPVRGRSEILPAPTAGPSKDGSVWPEPRFEDHGEIVTDRLTHLCWTRLADLAPGPVSWKDAFTVVKKLNTTGFASLSGWRIPTIREFESLTESQKHSPALPTGHPFTNTREAYWSSTNSGYEANWAMCHYLDKGAIGVGYKRDKGFHVWAVRAP